MMTAMPALIYLNKRDGYKPPASDKIKTRESIYSKMWNKQEVKFAFW